MDMLRRFTEKQGRGVLALITAVMVLTGCESPGLLFSDKLPEDSLMVHINSRIPFGHLDIFVYKDTLTQPLESHFRCGSNINLRLPCMSGGKIIAAIGDINGELAPEMIPDRFSVLEQLSMDYAEECPDAPLQSGFATAERGGRCELTLSPLLCSVELGKLSIEGDSPLLDPVAQLVNVSASAKIFQSDGFHPSYTLDSPQSLKYPLMMIGEIPFDIGNTPREADVKLYCYPNEDAEFPSGNGTILRISGRLRGRVQSYEIPLGVIKRGSSHKISDCVLN